MMKHFLTRATLTLLLSAGLVCTGLAGEYGDKKTYKEGKQYQALVPPRKPVDAKPGKIVVEEFFWYGCSHCYALEPYLEKWEEKKPKNVEFVRLPATLAANWQTHAYVYFTLEALGRLDLHSKIFSEIHNKKKRMTATKQITNFVVKHGVDKDKFIKTLNSFLVKTKVTRADKAMRDYEIASVPYIIVNGRYTVSPADAGGYAETVDVMKYLIGLERKRLSQAKKKAKKSSKNKS